MMDSLGGLSAFFYNIIPGVLFLLVLNELTTLEPRYLTSEGLEGLFWIMVSGLFLGFLGQALLKLFLNDKVNVPIFREIKDNNKQSYEEAIRILSSYKIVENNSKIDDVGEKGEKTLRNTFYAMDNYLRNNNTSFVINHFADRAAFWFNISVGSFILVITIALWPDPSTSNLSGFYTLVLLFLGILSFCFFGPRSMKAQYESILQTYVQIVPSIERPDNSTKRNRKSSKPVHG